MNIQVRYLSKSGNTEKVAQAIANAVGVQAQTVAQGITGDVDVLFLGGAIYAGSIDKEIKNFITNLSANIKKVVLFSTTAGKKSASTEMKGLLAQKGIPVAEPDFHCRGKFLLVHSKNPNAEDLKQAADFAKKAVG